MRIYEFRVFTSYIRITLLIAYVTIRWIIYKGLFSEPKNVCIYQVFPGQRKTNKCCENKGGGCLQSGQLILVCGFYRRLRS